MNHLNAWKRSNNQEFRGQVTLALIAKAAEQFKAGDRRLAPRILQSVEGYVDKFAKLVACEPEIDKCDASSDPKAVPPVAAVQCPNSDVAAAVDRVWAAFQEAF